METVNIAISDSFKDYIHELIKADQKKKAEEMLEAEIMKGLESGESYELTPEVWG